MFYRDEAAFKNKYKQRKMFLNKGKNNNLHFKKKFYYEDLNIKIK